jgi:hypothetical protein
MRQVVVAQPFREGLAVVMVGEMVVAGKLKIGMTA